MVAHTVEGRRLVLKGRRTVTRHYYSKFFVPIDNLLGINCKILFKFSYFFRFFLLFFRYSHHIAGMLLPAWLVIVLVAIAEIIVGVVLYFVLRKFVLSKANHKFNTYQPAQMEEAA